MTDISERADALRRWKCTSYCLCGSRKGHFEAHDEGAWVLYTDALAEIDRLRAEVERLTRERDDAEQRVRDIDALWHGQRDVIAERDQLRAEVERLRQYEPLPGGVPLREVLLQREVERLTRELARYAYPPDHRVSMADAEIDRLRAEVERLTRERGEWARKWHRIRGELAEIKWPGMKGVIRPKRAYYETHDPPHCPTCGRER